LQSKYKFDISNIDNAKLQLSQLVSNFILLYSRGRNYEDYRKINALKNELA